MIDESIFTAVTITGISVYGLTLLFIKALFILLLAQTLVDQFEYSPASIRHTIWLLALMSLVALPVVTYLLPGWYIFTIELPTTDGIVSAVTEPASLAVAEPLTQLSLLDWLVSLYLIVALARLAYLIYEIVKVAMLTATAIHAHQDWYVKARHSYNGRLKIKLSPVINGPVTWGTLHPVILLPENSVSWSALEREMVLRHELGHIQRRDWLAQLLGQLAAILYWPVPGIGKALRSLSLEAERACDDRVLADGATPADYAALLLRQARVNTLQVNTLQATVALGKPSELAQRIRHIINSYVDRAGERRARLWLSAGASLFLLPFASIQAIGSLPQNGPLSGKLLIPIATAAKQKPVNNTAVSFGESSININRPTRPVFTQTLPDFPEQERGGTAIDSATLPFSSPPSSAEALSLSPSTAVDVTSYRTNPVSSSQAKLVSRMQPEYPAAAKRRGLEGRVIVEFDIDTDGRVINPRIITQEASSMFNRAVLKAIRGYQYQPYRLGGQAIGLQGLQEEFRFQLISDQSTNPMPSGDSRAGQQVPPNSS